MNNINAKAFVYKNTLNDVKTEANTQAKNNYTRLKLKGAGQNPQAINAEVTVFYNNQKQTGEILSGRGYLSKSEDILHFGLGLEDRLANVVFIEFYCFARTKRHIFAPPLVHPRTNHFLPFNSMAGSTTFCLQEELFTPLHIVK